MTRYRFELAQPSDDEALRRVMASTPMPGSVTLTFGREPSYFDSECVLGPDRSTIVCRDTDSGDIVIVASRSVRDMYVGGVHQRVGYLGGLRFVSRVRSQGLLARGFRFLRQIHDEDDHSPDFYLTTIADNNTRAIDALTSGRAGLPRYHPLSRLHTLVVPINQHSRAATNADSQYQIDCANDLPALIQFLNQHGQQKSFFPRYHAGDLLSGDGTFQALDLSSIVVVKRSDEIIGAAGLWDQRSFRQTIVNGYSPAVRLLRPVVNSLSRISGGVQLPRVGEALNACFVCFPVVVDNDESVMRILIERLTRSAPGNADVVLVGFCDNDPLLPVAKTFSRSEYTTNLYAVSWGELPTAISTASPYYLELGCL